MKAILVLAALSLIIREAAAQTTNTTNGTTNNISGTNGLTPRVIGRLQNSRASSLKSLNGSKSPIFDSPTNWKSAHGWLAQPRAKNMPRNILIWYPGWWSELDYSNLRVTGAKEFRANLRDINSWPHLGWTVITSGRWISGGGTNSGSTNNSSTNTFGGN